MRSFRRASIAAALVLLSIQNVGASTEVVNLATSEYVIATTIDAAPGYFEESLLDLKTPAQGTIAKRIKARFLKTQSDGTWAPVIAVCTQGSDEKKPRVCLNLVVTQEGSVTAVHRERSDERELTVRNDLPNSYEAQATFDIRVESGAKSTEFYLYDTLLFSSLSIGSPLRIVLFCSSAVCSFGVQK